MAKVKWRDASFPVALIQAMCKSKVSFVKCSALYNNAICTMYNTIKEKSENAMFPDFILPVPVVEHITYSKCCCNAIKPTAWQNLEAGNQQSLSKKSVEHFFKRKPGHAIYILDPWHNPILTAWFHPVVGGVSLNV